MKFLILLSCIVYVHSCGMPGSYCQIDANSPEVQKVLDFAVAQYAGKNGLTADQLTTTVKHVETQVVAGLNYKMTVEINNGGQKMLCHFVVYNRWDGYKELTTSQCSAAGNRVFVGGHEHVDPNDKDLMASLEFAVAELNKRSNNLYKMMLTSKRQCTKQVVSGMRYDCTITLGESTCSTYDTDLSACALKAGGMHTSWHVSVVSQPWMTPKFQLVTSELVKEKQTTKRPKKPIRPRPDIIMQDGVNNLLGKDWQKKVGSVLGENILGKLRNGVIRDGAKQKIAKLLGSNSLDLKDKDANKVVNSILELGKQNIREYIPDKGLKQIGKLMGGIKNLLGGDGHDMLPHGIKKNLGGDGHDMQPHGNKMNLGGDGHDMQPHGNKMNLGGDGHDMLPHGNKMNLGGDGHDMLPHGNKMNLGGDGHDMLPHGNKMNLGGDGHDMLPHGNKMNLGGDGHDMQPHGNKMNLGGDGHDMLPHGNKMNLGGDGHDMLPHGNKMNLGGDGHDMLPHGNKMNLGGDGHDMLPHGNKEKLLGGDRHDLCHYGMFVEFQKKHNRLYSTSGEEKKRFKIFCDNMATARTLQKHEMGTATYGATMFADLTESEFKQYVGKPWDLNANVGMEKAKIPQGKIPNSFDWRNHNAVTPVKNQGTCGSCWAFSTTGNLEGQWSIKHGKLISLSEQELVDCDKVDEGCNGGLPSNAYKEIIRLGGIESEEDYKYVGHNEKCFFNKTECRVSVNRSVSISSNETEMASWLALNGPISIGINAFAMQFYMGGISHPWKIFCNPKSLDHGVLIVGYDEDASGTPYWIVKNSWGPTWGEKGYYLVYRGAGVCGLNTMCTSGLVN